MVEGGRRGESQGEREGPQVVGKKGLTKKNKTDIFHENKFCFVYACGAVIWAAHHFLPLSSTSQTTIYWHLFAVLHMLQYLNLEYCCVCAIKTADASRHVVATSWPVSMPDLMDDTVHFRFRQNHRSSIHTSNKKGNLVPSMVPGIPEAETKTNVTTSSNEGLSCTCPNESAR